MSLCCDLIFTLSKILIFKVAAVRVSYVDKAKRTKNFPEI